MTHLKSGSFTLVCPSAQAEQRFATRTCRQRQKRTQNESAPIGSALLCSPVCARSARRRCLRRGRDCGWPLVPIHRDPPVPPAAWTTLTAVSSTTLKSADRFWGSKDRLDSVAFTILPFVQQGVAKAPAKGTCGPCRIMTVRLQDFRVAHPRRTYRSLTHSLYALCYVPSPPC